jgi:hypothetical protein
LLRNLRYDFVKAVADIVDNSIQAGATRVDITMKFEGKDSWIRISDNGKGMTSNEITEAMRLGTKRDYDKNELGRFGLGMKTASISQCRRLTVASRSTVEGADIEVRRFDLDEIERSDSWEIIDLPPAQCSPKIIEPLINTNGTVIFWDFLDRIMRYRIPSGAAANKRFNDLARELEDHLSMVFHMFLSGEVKNKKLQITLNRQELKPWDPFARSETGTLHFEDGTLTLQGPEGPYSVKYSSFVLPTLYRFSSRDAFEYYGRGKWNELQGLYFYRENRLIQYGGWSNLRIPEEHIKYARVGLFFGSDADAALDIDVKKSEINMQVNLREALMPIVKNVTTTADKLYRSGEGGGQSRVNSSNVEKTTLTGDGGFDTEHTTTDGNYVETHENNITKGATESDHESYRKMEAPQSDKILPPESDPRALFEELTKLIPESDPKTDLILISLKLLFWMTFRVAAEKAGEEEALKKIIQNIQFDFPDIASFLGL